MIKVPSGTQPGKVFRLKGLGITKSNGYGRGDQLVYLNIIIPKNLNEKQKSLMEELAKEFSETNPKTRKGFKDKFIEMFE